MDRSYANIIVYLLVLAIDINLMHSRTHRHFPHAICLEARADNFNAVTEIIYAISKYRRLTKNERILSLVAVFPIPLIVLCHVALSRRKLSRSGHALGRRASL